MQIMDDLETQITEEVVAITSILEQQLGRRSRWNGEVELSDDPTAFGKALWNGRISLNRQLAQTDLRWRTLIHGALHYFSVGLNRGSYAELRGWEEGVVEQLQRTLRPSILRSLNVAVPVDIFVNIEQSHNYNRFISALAAMRQELNEPQDAFYLGLLAASLKERPAEVLELSKRLISEDRTAFRKTFALSFSVLRR